MRYLLIIALCLYSQITESRDWHDWKDTEKAEYIGYTFLNYTDFRQTELCVSQKLFKCEEHNPLLGKHPSDATIAAGFLINQVGYYMLIKYSDDYPILEQTRWILFGAKVSIVWANDYNGLRVNKVW